MTATLGASDATGLENWLPDVWRQLVHCEMASGPTIVVRIAYRQSGRLIAEHQLNVRSLVKALRPSLERLASETTEHARRQIDLVEVGTCDRFQEATTVPWARHVAFLTDDLRGVLGYELSMPGAPLAPRLIFPQQVVATNRSPKNWVAEYALMPGSRDGVQVRTFVGRQWLVRQRTGDHQCGRPSRGCSWNSGGSIIPCVRGARLIDESEVTPEALRQLEELLANYLVASVQHDGRMRYLVEPSRRCEDRSRNNAIRQWMATIALARVAQRRQDAKCEEILHRNANYNLARMFTIENGRGLIHDGDRVKLGAVALAWIALNEAGHSGTYEFQRTALAKTLDELWMPSGQFRTFVKPADRSDQWNFYPGEALLAWSVMYRSNRDAALLDRIMASFRFYRDWHRENRNPAFIPWHTRAYTNIYRETGASELQSFIFEMNDWLLSLQQWDDAPSVDCRGRFYDPRRPFGPPHSSSTGVYLEGLVAALSIARTAGDKLRIERYRTALLRGFRSVLQLTYQNSIDLYYVPKQLELCGGVRSSEYDNRIRVDNVQHSLMAVQGAAKAIFEHTVV